MMPKEMLRDMFIKANEEAVSICFLVHLTAAGGVVLEPRMIIHNINILQQLL